MKYIFDFDDVLFHNTSLFKPHIFKLISEAGVLEDEARIYYLEVRVKEFSLRNFITTLLSKHNIKIDENNLYEKIMKECPNFLNTELIKKVKTLGKENYYIITNGEREFNTDKLKYSGAWNIFLEDHIFIVPGSKKEAIEKICLNNNSEEVIFIDDKESFFKDIDFIKCPNLKTILYTGQNLDNLSVS